MKKIYLSVFGIILTFCSAAMPADSSDPSAEKSFAKDFSAAENIVWYPAENFLKVRFSLAGQYIEAHYAANGDLLYVERNINSDQLPLLLCLRVKKMLENSWITSVQEIVTERTHLYRITIENSNETNVYISRNDRKWILKETLVRL